MKVVFCIGSLNTGGAERVVSLLANYWAKKRWEIHIVKFDKKDSFYTLDDKIQLHSLNLLKTKDDNIFKFIIRSFKRLKSLVKILSKHRPNAVISFMPEANFLSIVACRLTKVPVICSERSAAKRSSKYYKFLKRLIYPLANSLVLQTEENAPYFKFIKNKHVIPNPIPKQFDITVVPLINRPKTILAVGRLDRVKGFDLLIKAFASIEDKKGYKLTIIGEGSEKESLEKLMTTIGASGTISILGFKKDIYPYYMQARIFVLSSRYEGFPNALLEAMGHGCAVISTDCETGPKTLIQDGLNGLLAKNGNIHSLREKILFLINNESIQSNLSMNARIVNQLYSFERIASKWELVIKKLNT